LAYEDYIKIMAKNCFQVFEDMSHQQPVGVSIEEVQPPYTAADYTTAIVIPFKNREKNIEGRFILGLHDEEMAVVLASAIAEKMGLPAVDSLNDLATDILSEFMNTVAGMVITEWDKLGLSADFSAPEFRTNLTFESSNDCDLLINSVTLLLAGNKKLTILTTIEERNANPFTGKKVLVVDDSKMVRHLLSKELNNQGCQVSEAENGLEGFIKTKAVQPDLIVMDLVMPKMGGLEAIAQIREIDPLVPIIVLTSSAKKDEVVAAAEHKVKGYIRKPIKMDRILELAQSCFN